MSIERIEVSHHQLPLDPPFPAAWDPQPRRLFPATVVRVHDSSGLVGVGSGDAMYGFEDYVGLFVGENPSDLERHGAVIENVSFHAGRCWPLDVALHDLAGQIRGEPVSRMLGGRGTRVRAYASSGMLRGADETVSRAKQLVERGFAALKLRFGRARLEDDFAVLAAVRGAVGSALELMVDCNQGWRMPWDTGSPWEYAKAREVAEELRLHDVYWMEEPLHRGDYAGMARLRSDGSVRIAGAELTRERYELDTLLERECLDVYQADAVCTVGLGGLADFAARVEARGCVFTPHTWGNGLGLLANLHLTVGAAAAPFLEYPIDEPEWSVARRDFLLAEPVGVDADGWLTVGPDPGLGLRLDEARLAATRSAGQTYV
ncbi:MAG: mandelate racemase/muconate lactonizing enzyme family protein [Myxococcota bacterium]